MEPYENTLSIERLREECREAWNESMALNNALIELPETLGVDALRAIEHAAMNIREPDMFALGKALQRKHGIDAIPPKTERECAAGLWSIIRAALIAAKQP